MRDSKDWSLDEWSIMFRSVYYYTQNAERDTFRVFAGLVSAAGQFWKRVYNSEDYEEAQRWLAKVLAWYFALATKVGMSDISVVVWSKFPGYCPFCRQCPCVCSSVGKQPINRGLVKAHATRHRADIPRTLSEWQAMFDRIYQHSKVASALSTSAQGRRNDDQRLQLLEAGNKLVEELGEVADAIVMLPFSGNTPDDLHDEMADVFAWICGAANSLPGAIGASGKLDLAAVTWTSYPDKCPYCDSHPCVCAVPPVQRLLKERGLDPRGVDFLTGVYRVDRFKADMRRFSQQPVETWAVVFFDVDDFSQFNAESHEQGDHILRELAERFSLALEGAGGLYRYGGDEFVALFVNVDEDDLRQCIESARLAVSSQGFAHFKSRSPVHEVTLSIGAAWARPSSATLEECLAAADAASKKVKQSGKDGFELVRLDESAQ